MITATFTPEFARRILDGLDAGAFNKHLSTAAQERLRSEALRSLPAAESDTTPTARVLGVRTRQGHRIAAVQCPFCGGAHKHRWRPGDREPGERQAPCTDFRLRYTLAATAEQIAREAQEHRAEAQR